MSAASGSDAVGEEALPVAPLGGAVVPLDDGLVGFGFEAGAIEEGAEEAVGVEDGADDGDVGVGVAEVFDDFVVPLEEVFAVAGFGGAAGLFDVVEDDAGGAEFSVADAAHFAAGGEGFDAAVADFDGAGVGFELGGASAEEGGADGGVWCGARG